MANPFGYGAPARSGGRGSGLGGNRVTPPTSPMIHHEDLLGAMENEPLPYSSVGDAARMRDYYDQMIALQRQQPGPYVPEDELARLASLYRQATRQLASSWKPSNSAVNLFGYGANA